VTRSPQDRGICRVAALLSALVVPGGVRAGAQSPRDANPERPTFATHAYAVAPGYVELEQGLAARGVHSLREETSWDVNLKFGVAPHLQVALFGPFYSRGPLGSGVGDLGVALKLRTDVSPRTAVAVVSSLTAPTGRTALGLGAGRALGGLVGVVSSDLPAGVHVDVNAGPQGLGAGRAQWFMSVSGARGFGRIGVTFEVFTFTAGGAAPRAGGLLGALTLRTANWMIIDVGGVTGTIRGTADQAFLGLTTNLGRAFR
jgi:hypothetical protein